MSKLPRGIAPELLLSQIRNTMPYLFDEASGADPFAAFPPARHARELAADPERELSHFEYYRLCLSAHCLTVATPVPTDVDIQIRKKLWPAQLPLATALEMADLVLECRSWDFGLVTGRMTHGLCGHHGEWFTVACGAYCAMAQYRESEARAKQRALYDAIDDETRRHSEAFGSLWRAKEGLDCLKVSAAIAHNFGDLDRVMDMWELPPGDPLRLHYYKLGISPFDAEGKLRYLGRLWVAGELYKSPLPAAGGGSMAFENHRHFALRKPRCLRRSPEFLITTGPFFDDWGRRVARGLAAQGGAISEDTLEVVEALRHGWERLPKSVGYARALRGMREIHSGLDVGNSPLLKTTQEKFEKLWADAALELMDEIPSRA